MGNLVFKRPEVDDSKFAYKYTLVDEIVIDEWDKGGPRVAITYLPTAPEEKQRIRSDINKICNDVWQRSVTESGG
jgi:hypothetical protein